MLWYTLPQTILAAVQSVLLVVIIGVTGQLREFRLAKPAWRDILLAIATACALGLLARGVAASIELAGLADTAPLVQLPRQTLPEPPAQWSVALGWGLLALNNLSLAYREELLYRVCILGSLVDPDCLATRTTLSIKHGSARLRWRPLLALVLSVACFSLGHGHQGIAGLLNALVAGIFLALAWLAGSGLHALAWGHGLYNLAVMLQQTGY
jgi:membrane protease YdiL (CAAX protease family)